MRQALPELVAVHAPVGVLVEHPVHGAAHRLGPVALQQERREACLSPPELAVAVHVRVGEELVPDAEGVGVIHRGREPVPLGASPLGERGELVAVDVPVVVHVGPPEAALLRGRHEAVLRRLLLRRIAEIRPIGGLLRRGHPPDVLELDFAQHAVAVEVALVKDLRHEAVDRPPIRIVGVPGEEQLVPDRDHELLLVHDAVPVLVQRP
mmetsp:Transcript_97347/g.272424  ORF Transcript_97347/g.272424 Transcript_97347/m.272424 type:complete len:208 (-) Transcript_97347:28-651(-)